MNKIHQENIDYNDYKKMKKNNEVMEKQKKINDFLERNYLEKKKFMENKQYEYEQKEKDVIEKKRFVQNMKTYNSLTRINEMEKRHKKQLEDIKKYKDLYSEVKKEKEKEKIGRIEYMRTRIENNYRDNLKRDMEEKEKRYEEKRNEAQKKIQKKYEFINRQKKEKEEIKLQFEELTTKNIGEIDIDKIKKLFPDDEELHEKLEKTREEFEIRKNKQIEAYERDKFQRREMLKKYKRPHSSHNIRIQKENQNSISKANKNMNNINANSNINNYISNNNITKSQYNMNNKQNKSRPKTVNKKKSADSYVELREIPMVSRKEELNENKIKFMVQDYKDKLLKDLLNLCNKENEKENKRKELLKEIKSEMEMKRLEKIFAMQRAQSTDKIGEFNNLIDEKVEKYEKELKAIYEKQKK